MFLTNLALLCRFSIGDVRQTVDSRERIVMGLNDNLGDKLFCTRRDPTLLLLQSLRASYVGSIYMTVYILILKTAVYPQC